ncbi:YppF family protein [Rossellomorea sp. SC111]|uniref:YppF family protein n=1 Tax=Rossellomorea sp. SC111 TaxID=2968985 RepID=UPI00215AA942|nr:YppF family protein [Rossellomorea sp. SC111]MCR8846900.1 YppF family protein [Rossellomorea sp. SC111]
MDLNELLKRYESSKQYQATDQQELLTLAKKLYISNEISFHHYKGLAKEINTIEENAI